MNRNIQNNQNNNTGIVWVDQKSSRLWIVSVFFFYIFVGYIFLFNIYKPELLYLSYMLAYILGCYIWIAMIVRKINLFCFVKPACITKDGIKIDSYPHVLQDLCSLYCLRYLFGNLFFQHKKSLVFLPWPEIKYIFGGSVFALQLHSPFIAIKYLSPFYIHTIKFEMIIESLDGKIHSQFINDKDGFMKAMNQFRDKDLNFVKLHADAVKWSR